MSLLLLSISKLLALGFDLVLGRGFDRRHIACGDGFLWNEYFSSRAYAVRLGKNY